MSEHLTPEALIKDWEKDSLSPYAVKSQLNGNRAQPEEPCSLRTCFQRDRDRIVHSKSFRRLKRKTQVFISPEGDHYRTRLTHTLEVSGISRTAARALRLNEDLAEAISLGHDLGHTPFGHIGEEALSGALQRVAGRRFEHNKQSLRVVQVLERDGQGLNLCREVEDGILCHTGSQLPATLEGRIVRIADRIAYINHDIDDAIRAGIISFSELPAAEIDLLGCSCSQRIDALVHDLVNASWQQGDIRQSPHMAEAMNRLRRFLFDRVYLGLVAKREAARVARLVDSLFSYYWENHQVLPDWLLGVEPDRVTATADHIACMTDRFAIKSFQELFMPSDWKM